MDHLDASSASVERAHIETGSVTATMPVRAAEVVLLAPARSEQHVRSQAVVERPSLTLKRTFDIVFSLLVLLAALPFLLTIAVAIKLDSPGPVFFRVRRVGHRGDPLMILKFRKMHDHASGGPLTVGGDPRLTRIGAILTRTRLDELPQFWDVLRGRMSIVGPRPEDPAFVALHPEDYARILAVKPGITGLSQLAYASESTILRDEDPVEDYINRILPQKLGMDTLYARLSGMRLDLAILFWTVVTVLLGRPVAVNRSTARMNIRRRRVPLEQTKLAAGPELVPDPVGSTVTAASGPALLSE